MDETNKISRELVESQLNSTVGFNDLNDIYDESEEESNVEMF